MIVVFLSFMLGTDVGVKQIGLGLATAVLIDATIVRMVLVPAVMELLGKANWWLPGPLGRILPKASFSVEPSADFAERGVPALGPAPAATAKDAVL
jgi:RND superfamily putative drug exporter